MRFSRELVIRVLGLWLQAIGLGGAVALIALNPKILILPILPVAFGAALYFLGFYAWRGHVNDWPSLICLLLYHGVAVYLILVMRFAEATRALLGYFTLPLALVLLAEPLGTYVPSRWAYARPIRPSPPWMIRGFGLLFFLVVLYVLVAYGPPVGLPRRQ